jgi:hypothetical protein
MRSVLATVLFGMMIMACVPANKDPQHPGAGSGSGSGSDDVVCHEVTDTGSLFSHTECVPKDESQAQRDDAQRFMKTPRATLSPAQTGPGPK